MAEQFDHECLICGTRYRHCNACKTMHDFRPWRAVTDTAECYEAFLALREYQAERMTKERFREVLMDLGFAEKKVRPEVAAIFDEVLTEEPKAEIPAEELVEAKTEPVPSTIYAHNRKRRK